MPNARLAGNAVAGHRSRVVLGTLAAVVVSLQASAATLTQDEATAKVLENGFTFVVKTEAARTSRLEDVASWDVWASKYGIAYRVTVDATTGDLTGAAPAVEND